MRISNRETLEPAPTWPTLLRLRGTLGANAAQMAELMELAEKDYLRLEHGRLEPSVRALMSLCEHLQISFERLMTGTICYKTAAQQFDGKKAAIPEKYLLAGRSKRRVLANLLDFVETATDWHRRLELMRYLQINETALSDPDGTVNLRCTVDAIEWLAQQARRASVLELLGEEIILGPQSASVMKALEKSRTIYELFEGLFSESGVLYAHFERNFLWKIERIKPGEKISVRGYLSEEIRGQISDSHIRSAAGSVVRSAIVSAAPMAAGWGRVPVVITDFFTRKSDGYALDIDISQCFKSKKHLALVC